MDAIPLTLINDNSALRAEQQIQIFSSDPTAGDQVLAWKIIQYLGRGSRHPFELPMVGQAAGRDSFGNVSTQLTAQPGARFAMVRDASGDVLQKSEEPAGNPNAVEIANELPQGVIDALVYRDGDVFTEQRGLAVAQVASFVFKPVLFFSVVSHTQITNGEITATSAPSRLDFVGIASADIALSGGEADEFVFKLQNMVPV